MEAQSAVQGTRPLTSLDMGKQSIESRHIYSDCWKMRHLACYPPIKRLLSPIAYRLSCGPISYLFGASSVLEASRIRGATYTAEEGSISSVGCTYRDRRSLRLPERKKEISIFPLSVQERVRVMACDGLITGAGIDHSLIRGDCVCIGDFPGSKDTFGGLGIYFDYYMCASATCQVESPGKRIVPYPPSLHRKKRPYFLPLK